MSKFIFRVASCVVCLLVWLVGWNSSEACVDPNFFIERGPLSYVSANNQQSAQYRRKDVSPVNSCKESLINFSICVLSAQQNFRGFYPEKQTVQ